ncbi:TPA: hypothetical protein HA219_00885 [Candidatus Woesearchaeota archaeon]|nr:hypothetical protein [Candidatus Woesearchaeota archaeon]HIH39267.1 hypothetical protein [Candidatus Woesearchaeota archaeon]
MEEKSTFIKIDRFETAMSALSAIKKKLMEAQATLNKINEVKQEEDAAVQKWTSDLASVQSKIESVEAELMKEQ